MTSPAALCRDGFERPCQGEPSLECAAAGIARQPRDVHGITADRARRIQLMLLRHRVSICGGAACSKAVQRVDTAISATGIAEALKNVNMKFKKCNTRSRLRINRQIYSRKQTDASGD